MRSFKSKLAAAVLISILGGVIAASGSAATRTYTLTITVKGTGSGSVAKIVSGAVYPLCKHVGSVPASTKTCTVTFPAGTVLKLRAIPQTKASTGPAQSKFYGWTAGDCAGAATGCAVKMAQNRSVEASFSALAFEGKLCTMPDLIDPMLTVDEAKSSITASGCKGEVQIDLTYRSGEGPGLVVAQDPAPDALVPILTEIHLSVSTGFGIDGATR